MDASKSNPFHCCLCMPGFCEAIICICKQATKSCTDIIRSDASVHVFRLLRVDQAWWSTVDAIYCSSYGRPPVKEPEPFHCCWCVSCVFEAICMSKQITKTGSLISCVDEVNTIHCVTRLTPTQINTSHLTGTSTSPHSRDLKQSRRGRRRQPRETIRVACRCFCGVPRRNRQMNIWEFRARIQQAQCQIENILLVIVLVPRGALDLCLK